MAIVCARCGVKQGLLATLSVDLTSGIYHCPKCADVMTAQRREKNELLSNSTVSDLSFADV